MAMMTFDSPSPWDKSLERSTSQKQLLDLPWIIPHIPIDHIPFIENIPSMTGWWYTYPSAKYESQVGWWFPIYGKIKFMFQTTNQMIFPWWFKQIPYEFSSTGPADELRRARPAQRARPYSGVAPPSRRWQKDLPGTCDPMAMNQDV